jgi:hypothetical protein
MMSPAAAVTAAAMMNGRVTAVMCDARAGVAMSVRRMTGMAAMPIAVMMVAMAGEAAQNDSQQSAKLGGGRLGVEQGGGNRHQAQQQRLSKNIGARMRAVSFPFDRTRAEFTHQRPRFKTSNQATIVV